MMQSIFKNRHKSLGICAVISSFIVTTLSFQNCSPNKMSVSSLSANKDNVISMPSLSKIPAANWGAQSNYIFDVVVFNWQYYLDANPDLRSNGILTEAQAKNHWQNSGIKEGRRASPEFYIKDYLSLNSDLENNLPKSKDLHTAAFEHYLETGRNEPDRQKIKPHIYGYNLGGSITGSNGDFTFGNEQVLFRTWGRYSGTVSEIWFRGKQYENNPDTGRLFQTAFTFDGAGECFNPTEGGMNTDVYFNGQNFTGKSQSILNHISASNGLLTATTTPAYWLAPNQSHYCGIGKGNGPISADQITKTITMNYAGDSQIVKWQVDIDVKNTHSAMRTEALTGYHNAEFTKTYNYNKNTKNLDLAANGSFIKNGTDIDQNSYRIVPQVVATADGNHAMGVVGVNKANQVTPKPDVTGYYNITVPNVTTKWSVHFGYGNDAKTGNAVPAGKYSTDVYLVFGNLEEVRQRMNFLEEHLNPVATVPVAPIVVVPPVVVVPAPAPVIDPVPVIINPPPPVEAAPTPIVFLPPAEIKIYRMRNANDYLITPYQSEGANAGYNLEGAFGFFANADSGARAIYRCSGSGGHFVSTVSNCESQSVEGILAYLSISNNSAGTLRPIYRIRTSAGNKLISYYETEGQAYGCVSEGLIGYGP